MTIQNLIDYLETLPDKSARVAFAEWRADGWHFITPANLPLSVWKPFERFGVPHQPVLNWDNCLADRIPESRLEQEADA